MDEQRLLTIRALCDRLGFHTGCGFRVDDINDGKVQVSMDVTPEVQNANGTLHGGAIATLVDHAGTIAIMIADRNGRPGVTTDLNVSYLAAGLGGSTVIAKAQALKIGAFMAYVTVDVRRTDGTLIAQGRMTKFQGR